MAELCRFERARALWTIAPPPPLRKAKSSRRVCRVLSPVISAAACSVRRPARTSEETLCVSVRVHSSSPSPDCSFDRDLAYPSRSICCMKTYAGPMTRLSRAASTTASDTRCKSFTLTIRSICDRSIINCPSCLPTAVSSWPSLPGEAAHPEVLRWRVPICFQAKSEPALNRGHGTR